MIMLVNPLDLGLAYFWTNPMEDNGILVILELLETPILDFILGKPGKLCGKISISSQT